MSKMILRMQATPRYKFGTPFADAGLRAERRVSALVPDSFFSLDGRFAAIARDLNAEHKVQYRFRVMDLSHIELWADGKLKARVSDQAVAVNWILLKIKRASEGVL
jgi:hypothetical protein